MENHERHDEGPNSLLFKELNSLGQGDMIMIGENAYRVSKAWGGMTDGNYSSNNFFRFIPPELAVGGKDVPFMYFSLTKVQQGGDLPNELVTNSLVLASGRISPASEETYEVVCF